MPQIQRLFFFGEGAEGEYTHTHTHTHSFFLTPSLRYNAYLIFDGKRARVGTHTHTDTNSFPLIHTHKQTSTLAHVGGHAVCRRYELVMSYIWMRHNNGWNTHTNNLSTSYTLAHRNKLSPSHTNSFPLIQTLQHAATRCNTSIVGKATHDTGIKGTCCIYCNMLRHAATRCNTL